MTIEVKKSKKPIDYALAIKDLEKRPLLNHNNVEETMNKIYLNRKKFYNESNFKIKCNSMDKDEIVYKIIELYENPGNKI